MPDTVFRFEFRVFGHDLDPVADRLRSLAGDASVSGSDDVYLVSGRAASKEFNAKIRDDRLSLKRLVERDGELERWAPVCEEAFPLPDGFLREALGMGLGGMPALPQGAGETSGALVRALTAIDLSAGVAFVHKRRHQFTLGDVAAEFDELLINGARIDSVAVEDASAAAVREAMSRLEIAERENVNYARQVRRVLGKEFFPGQPWWEPPGDDESSPNR